MIERLIDELDNQIRGINEEVEKLLDKRSKLEAALEALKPLVEVGKVGNGKKFLPKPMRDMQKLKKQRATKERRERVPTHESWIMVRNALKEMYPQKLSNRELAELLDIPLHTIRKVTARNRNQLKRERSVLSGDAHHGEYVMTLYPSHVLLAGKVQEEKDRESTSTQSEPQ